MAIKFTKFSVGNVQAAGSPVIANANLLGTAAMLSGPVFTKYGTVTQAPSGAFVFTPNQKGLALAQGKSVSDVAQFVVSTASGNVPVQLNFKVQGVNDAPDASAVRLEMVGASRVISLASSVQDPDQGDKLSFSLVGGTAGAKAKTTELQLAEGTLVLSSTGQLTFKTAAALLNSSGQIPATFDRVVSYTVKDKFGAEDTASIRIVSNGLDTTAPDAPLSLSLLAADDLGTDSTDGITSKASGLRFTGRAEPGATIKLFEIVNGSPVQLRLDAARSTLAGEDGTFVVTLANALGSGSHTLIAQAVDAAGNVLNAAAPSGSAFNAGNFSSPTTVVISTKATPNLPAPVITSTPLPANAVIQSVTSLAGTVASLPAGAKLAIFDGATQLGFATVSGTTWTFNTAGIALADGPHSLVARVIDVAGFRGPDSAPYRVTLDATAPATATPDLLASSDLGVSSTDNITSANVLKLVANVEKGTTVDLLEWNDINANGLIEGNELTVLASQVASATTVLFTVGTEGSPATSGAAAVPAAPVAAGQHAYLVRQQDAAGNVSPLSPADALTVTVTRDVPTATLEAVGSRMVNSGQGIALEGIATPGAIVNLFQDKASAKTAADVLLATVRADDQGQYSALVDLKGPLLNGVMPVVTAKVQSVAGTTGAATGSTVTFTYDTVAPNAPALDLPSTSDSGFNPDDNITSATDFTLNLTNLASGDTVVLQDVFNGETVTLGTLVASGASASLANLTLAEGVHQLRAVATDVAGNRSQAGVLTVTIDRTAPDALARPDLIAASDTGDSNTDNITTAGVVTLVQTVPAGTPAGQVTTYVWIDTNQTGAIEQGELLSLAPQGTPVVDNGTFIGRFDLSAVGPAFKDPNLPAGTFRLVQTVKDAAGNESRPSDVLQIVLDTTAPDNVGAVTTLVQATGPRSVIASGVFAEDLQPGETLKAYDLNGTSLIPLGTAAVDGNTWQITLTNNEGVLNGITRNLVLRATDVAGNVSPGSGDAVGITLGTSANDVIGAVGGGWTFGLEGNDIIGYTSGTKLMDGGEGNDLLNLFSDVFNDDLLVNVQNMERLGTGLSGLAGTVTLGEQASRAFANGITLSSVANQLTLDASQLAVGITTVGTSGNDVLQGGSRADNLAGGSGNDVITGNGGADTLNGGAGNDVFSVDSVDTLRGIATLVGGADSDTLRLDTGDAALELLDADLAKVSQLEVINLTGFGAKTLTLAAEASRVFQNNLNGLVVTASSEASSLALDASAFTVKLSATGGNGDDTLVGGTKADTLNGGSGDDLIRAAGNDTIDGGAGNDLLIATTTFKFIPGNLAGIETVQAAVGTDAIDLDMTGLAEAIQLTGNAVANRLVGGAGSDTLTGGAGNDTLTGNTSSDWFIVDAGTDRITDLSASDVLRVEVGATADALVSAAFTATANTLNQGVANLTTAGFAVNLAAVTSGNGFRVINTGSGATLTGSSLDDTLIGGTGADTLAGGAGNDVLTGGTGSDLFQITAGSDRISDLGAGDDFTIASAATASITVASAFTATVATRNDGSAELTTQGHAVNLSAAIGSQGFNVVNTGAATNLTGSANNDTLTGGAGADTLVGGGGVDLIVGGKGVDALTGGAGSDVFVFNTGDTGYFSGGNPTSLSAFDTITDYAGDTIRFNGANFTYSTMPAPNSVVAAGLNSAYLLAIAYFAAGQGDVFFAAAPSVPSTNSFNVYAFLNDSIDGATPLNPAYAVVVLTGIALPLPTVGNGGLGDFGGIGG